MSNLNNNPGCLGYVLQLLGIRPKSKPTSEEVIERFPYSQRDDFLSDAELSFYHVLRESIDDQLIICPKVTLKEFFFVTEKGRGSQSYFNKINSKHVDFLLCMPNTMKPICGIELDDSSHERSDRIIRDRFVDEVFRNAGLQLVRIKNKRSYSINEIKESVLPVLETHLNSSKNNTSISNQMDNQENEVVNTAQEIVCPKCGSQMILREAKRGENVGKKFYGCTNYPKCKEIIEIN